MKASVADLLGKYYGTKVIYGNEHEITIWTHDQDFTPSTRQLAYWEMTLDEAKDNDMMCDSHYETQEDYDVAVKICYALRDDSEIIERDNMKTSKDGLVIKADGTCIIPGECETLIMDSEFKGHVAVAYAKSDLEKFIELYRSVGIELEPVLWDTYTGKQYLKIELEKDTTPGNVETRIWFNESGKFIQQGIWE